MITVQVWTVTEEGELHRNEAHHCDGNYDDKAAALLAAAHALDDIKWFNEDEKVCEVRLVKQAERAE